MAAGGTEPADLLRLVESFVAVLPVLARLCCLGGSESEGERDRLRFESASGMANSMIFFKYYGSMNGWGSRACFFM